MGILQSTIIACFNLDYNQSDETNFFFDQSKFLFPKIDDWILFNRRKKTVPKYYICVVYLFIGFSVTNPKSLINKMNNPNLFIELFIHQNGVADLHGHEDLLAS